MLEHTPDSNYSIASRADGGLELALASKLGLERLAGDAAAALARNMGFPIERVHDIVTVVAEATLNAIEHGNALDQSRLVRVLVIPGACYLEIQVWDTSATPFEPESFKGEPPGVLDRLDPTRPGRGWGLFLIQSLADEVDYSATPTGNRVRVRMYLGDDGVSTLTQAVMSS